MIRVRRRGQPGTAAALAVVAAGLAPACGTGAPSAPAARTWREVRADQVRGEIAIAGSQLVVVDTFAGSLGLTDSGRAGVTRALGALQLRLDEAKNHAAALAAADPDAWRDRHVALDDALARLEHARLAAWRALEAPRVEGQPSA